jgi:hypothetical protein
MIPLLITHAEIAIFPAWKDGHPYLGPGLRRGAFHPILSCMAAVSATETRRPAAPAGFDWRGGPPSSFHTEWEIAVDAQDGIHADELSVLPSKLPDGGFYILVVRFVDPETRLWRCLRWYYVSAADDELHERADAMRRGLRFRAGWFQETVGDGGVPALSPVVFGEVEWRCGSQCVTAWIFDPDTETWTSTPQNETGDGSRYVEIAISEEDENDLVLAAYFPRAAVESRATGLLPRRAIAWGNHYLLTIGNHLSAWCHGMRLHDGINVQTNGTPEPLLTVPQDRIIDEPVIVFRYLARVYAVIGHGVFAMPSLTTGSTPPPPVHDPAFILGPPGPVNPATGFTGLVLLPNAAYLDGTIPI